jgi:hypothetical protein
MAGKYPAKLFKTLIEKFLIVYRIILPSEIGSAGIGSVLSVKLTVTGLTII